MRRAVGGTAVIPSSAKPESFSSVTRGAMRTSRRAAASRRAKVSVSGCCAATATYSITAKNTAASLSSQFRRKNCPTLPGIDEPPDDGLVHGPVPLRRADHLLDDHAVAVDHEALGDAGPLVGCLDRAGAVARA